MVTATERPTPIGAHVARVRQLARADRPAPWAARPTPFIVRAVGAVIVAAPIVLWLGMETRHRWHQLISRLD